VFAHLLASTCRPIVRNCNNLATVNHHCAFFIVPPSSHSQTSIVASLELARLHVPHLPPAGTDLELPTIPHKHTPPHSCVKPSPCCRNCTNFAAVHTLRRPHHNCNKRDTERVLHRRTSGTIGTCETSPCGNPHGSQTLIAEREFWLERDCSDTWQRLIGLSTSQHWSTSQLWAKAVNVGQIGYFYTNFGKWFLCRNPK